MIRSSLDAFDCNHIVHLLETVKEISRPRILTELFLRI